MQLQNTPDGLIRAVSVVCLYNRKLWTEMYDAEAADLRGDLKRAGFQAKRNRRNNIVSLIQVEHVDAPKARWHTSPAGQAGTEIWGQFHVRALKDERGEWI